MPMRRRTPVMVVPRSHTYSSPRHDYGIEDSIHRADYLSSAVLEDTYDAATRSRGKDKDLLRNVNSAIESVFARAPSTGNLHASRPPLLRRYSRLVSVSPEPRLYSRATSLPPSSLPRRSVRSPSVAPVSPAIYYREVSMPPERRLSLYSRESSVLSEPQTTIRAQSVPRFVPALPTPRAILLSSGYQPYVRMYHRPVYRPVVSYRPTPARFVVRPTRPVMRPVMRKRKSRKIRVVKNLVRDVLADPLPPIPHLKQWSASPRVLARPWVPSTRMFPLEESEGGPPATVNIPAYYAAGGDPDNRPMSELRRKLRRTLAKSKNNPDYFKE